MHKYMRAIGFSEFDDKSKLQKLITDVIVDSDKRNCTTKSENALLAEFDKEFAPGLGIAVCGEFDNSDNFTYDYYYPYLVPTQISSVEDISVERHTEKESYAGVCDDIKMGVSVIFYLQDAVSYVKAMNTGLLPIRGTTLSLSALSTKGTIILPLNKRDEDVRKYNDASLKRCRLLAKARGGDEEAIESLTIDDMDIYTEISKRIHEDDVLTLVDTYFMPYGVECDLYSVMAEITDVVLLTNEITGEKIWKMCVISNGMPMDLCINEKDLTGEPAKGRRFKGVVWLQGAINYPSM